MLLCTTLFTDAQFFLIFLTASPHKSIAKHPWTRCYLSAILGKKLISEFEAHREFYGVGKE